MAGHYEGQALPDLVRLVGGEIGFTVVSVWPQPLSAYPPKYSAERHRSTGFVDGMDEARRRPTQCDLRVPEPGHDRREAGGCRRQR